MCPGGRRSNGRKRRIAGNDATVLRVRSRLIAPGSSGARMYHHAPHGGASTAGVRGDGGDTRPAAIHAHYLTTAYLARADGAPARRERVWLRCHRDGRRRLWRRAFRDLAGKGRRRARRRPAHAPIGDRSWVRARPGAHRPDRRRSRAAAVRRAAGAGSRPLRLVQPGDSSRRRASDSRFERFRGSMIDPARDPGDHRRRQAGPTPGQLARSRRPHPPSRSPARWLATTISRGSGGDILLAPSVTAANGDGEGGAPTTILDAQALGTIVVGSTHADIPFLVEDGTASSHPRGVSTVSVARRPARGSATRPLGADRASARAQVETAPRRRNAPAWSCRRLCVRALPSLARRALPHAAPASPRRRSRAKFGPVARRSWWGR